MSDYTPSTERVKNAYHWSRYYSDPRFRYSQGALKEFDRWLAQVEREAAARALAEIRREIRSIPHWWNSEEQRGGFDLQPLGPDASSEEGAFMEVMRVLDARAAEIRERGAE